MIKYKLNTAPINAPVSLADVKEFLRVYHTEQDDLIQTMLNTAIGFVEKQSYRRLITQTWDVVCDYWPEVKEVLKYGKLQAINSITYIDEDETSQTVSTGDYRVEGVGTDTGRIVFHSDGDFDYPSLFEVEPITIEFDCGYGDDADDVPEELKTAIKLKVQELYAGICTNDIVMEYCYLMRVWDFF